jgi:P27 family predicted phage terminase small subunit|uniref:Terminase small subunit n=1 Tax=Siphoviridae sp. ctQU013 TaxID=2826329 RepID=A0A8S5NLN5_9CAUD|nr:MAG TPA: terminase small subunit [Siphoviridae sp. ctQU013]
MPRLRKSDAEKSARGTLQKCRSSKPYPVSGSVLSEEPPVGIPGDAKEVWVLAVKNAPKGRLSVVDGPALEQWCRTYALWRRMAKTVEHGALFDEEETTGRRKLSPEFQAMQILVGTLIKLEKELGFTPVSRAHAPAQEEELLEKNPFEA